MPANKNLQRYKKKIKKKLNQNQRTRKVQHLKKKKKKYHQHHHHIQTISDPVVICQFTYSDMIQFIENATLSLSSSSFIKNKNYPVLIESNIDPTIFLTDYSTISYESFKEMVFTIIISDMDRNLMTKLLDTEEIFIFIRHLTQFVNKFQYFKLQNEQWTYYYNLGTNQGIWIGRISKNMALLNSMISTYGRSKLLIEQRQIKYNKKLTQINDDINEYMKQIPSILLIHMNKIMTIIVNLIYKDQYQLRIELQRRRNILKFDAKEHQLVQTFYNLKPRQTEIHSAQIIWKAIHDEQNLKYEIAMFKKWLSSNKSCLTYCTFQDLTLTKLNHIITHLIFNKHYSSKTIDTITMNTFIDDLTIETICIAEQMVQTYVQKVNDEKTKILNNSEKFKKLPTIDSIITAIEHRQINMLQRAQYHLEQSLKIIYGETFVTNQ